MPQSLPFQLLQKNQILSRSVLDLKSLHNVDMIPNINPLLNFLLHHFLLLLRHNLLEAVRTDDRVLLLEYQIGWRVHFVDWAFLYNRSLGLGTLNHLKLYACSAG